MINVCQTTKQNSNWDAKQNSKLHSFAVSKHIEEQNTMLNEESDIASSDDSLNAEQRPKYVTIANNKSKSQVNDTAFDCNALQSSTAKHDGKFKVNDEAIADGDEVDCSVLNSGEDIRTLDVKQETSEDRNTHDQGTPGSISTVFDPGGYFEDKLSEKYCQTVTLPEKHCQTVTKIGMNCPSQSQTVVQMDQLCQYQFQTGKLLGQLLNKGDNGTSGSELSNIPRNYPTAFPLEEDCSIKGSSNVFRMEKSLINVLVISDNVQESSVPYVVVLKKKRKPPDKSFIYN